MSAISLLTAAQAESNSLSIDSGYSKGLSVAKKTRGIGLEMHFVVAMYIAPNGSHCF